MAGEIALTTTLTENFVGLLRGVELELEIQLDLSHSEHVRTMRQDRPGQPIIRKPIELDCGLRPIANPHQLGQVIGRIQALKPAHPLFQFYQALQNVRGTHGGPEGLSALGSRTIKIEFANFDASIVNLNTPPTSLVNPLMACRAPTVAAFNALEAHIRQSMGMYLRSSSTLFALVGRREPQPRVAIA
jgi:hypothetical protein